MGGTLELPAKAPAQNLPPIMEVGFNYPWLTNNYGYSIGPDDFPAVTPPGWRRSPKNTPYHGLADNLKILRDDLKIKKVRMFLLCNAWNYGPLPTTSGTKSVFTAPPTANPLFFEHFKQMLEDFKNAGMQILPSLIDFGAFYPIGGGVGGGRTDILTSQRKTFLETMLKPMLAESIKQHDTIFAWEVVNEPVWNTVGASGLLSRPHTSSVGPDTDVAVMSAFINDCIQMIRGQGFAATVGHRFFQDLSRMPTGTMPQFHYYGRTNAAIGGIDPNPIPTFASLVGQPAEGAFVGEVDAAPRGASIIDDTRWPECNMSDSTPGTASFSRLSLLAQKGYKLAFIWPDELAGGWDDDNLKLSSDAQESIKKFTKGLFPNGVPAAPQPGAPLPPPRPESLPGGAD